MALKKEKRKDLDRSDKDILKHCISPLRVRGSETEGDTAGFLTAFFGEGMRDALGVVQVAQYLYFFKKKRRIAMNASQSIDKGYDRVCRRWSGFFVKSQIFFEFLNYFFAQGRWFEDFCICAMAQYPGFYVVRTAGVKGEDDFAVVQFFDFL